jgi:hypothetical protein
MFPICDLDVLIYILIVYMTNIMVKEVAQFCGKENLCYRSLAFMLWCPRNAMECEDFGHRCIS